MMTLTPEPLNFLQARRREAHRSAAPRPADPRALAIAATIRSSIDEFVRERSGGLKQWRQRR